VGSRFLLFVLGVVKILAPGTAAFFIASAGVCLILLRWQRTPRRVAMLGAVALVVLYFGMSLPWVAAHMAAPLRRFGPLADAGAARGALVVCVVVAGPATLRDALVDGGIPMDRVIVDSGGTTTHEQLANVVGILRGRGFGRLVLVASEIHMPRALATAEALGLDAVPSASATRRIAGRPRFWPTSDALRLSRESLYEYAALWYYGARGWMKPE
jgi:uncharacterized SAM-binding protein YcdF (DUF218 family)